MNENLIRRPFEAKTLEEERKDKPDIINVRFNAMERAWLDESKKNLHISRDSTALKILAEAGHNVLHGTLGAELLKLLTSERRIREQQE